jgi:small subunit ribosomal protein S16
MLTIRFARVGKVNKAQYKVVLQEKTVAPGGRHVEILGSYDPHSKQAVLKEEKIKYWISKGAQLSDTVHNLFASKGLIKEKKRLVKMPEKIVEEKPAGAEAPAENAEVKSEIPAEPVVEIKEEIKTEEVKAEETPKEEIKAE